MFMLLHFCDNMNVAMMCFDSCAHFVDVSMKYCDKKK